VHGSYWRENAPLIGVGLACIAILAATGIAGRLGQQPPAHYQSAGAADRAYDAPATFSGERQSSETGACYDATSDAEERDKCDLIAQQTVAEFTQHQTYINFFALVVLVFTAWFARNAWLAAKASAKADNDALEITRKQLARAESEARIADERFHQQLAAAWATAEATREVGRKQVRAYLSVEAIKYSVSRGRVVLSLDLLNTGQSPARELRTGYASIEFWFHKEGETERISCALASNTFMTAPDVPANQPGRAVCDLMLPPDVAARIMERVQRYKYNVSADLILTYEDVFQEREEIPVQGQSEVSAGQLNVQLGRFGGKHSKPMIVHNNQTRTCWNRIGGEISLPDPLPGAPEQS
jgi:hypothetical protein